MLERLVMSHIIPIDPAREKTYRNEQKQKTEIFVGNVGNSATWGGKIFKKITRKNPIHLCCSFSIRVDTLSFEVSVAPSSRSIRRVTESPSLTPGGSSDAGTVRRTGSPSAMINTAIPSSIRSMVAFISPHSDFWSMIFPFPSFRIAMSPLLPHTGSVLPMKRAELFVVPVPEKTVTVSPGTR